MKKILIVCLVAMFAIACAEKETPAPKSDVLTVKRNGEVIYADNDIEWRLVANAAAVTPPMFDLFMDGTRFMEAMPMLDMEVNSIENQHSNPQKHFLYEAEAVVPSIRGNLMPNYTLTNFRCEAEGWVVLKVSFTCMGCDVTYKKSL